MNFAEASATVGSELPDGVVRVHHVVVEVLLEKTIFNDANECWAHGRPGGCDRDCHGALDILINVSYIASSFQILLPED